MSPREADSTVLTLGQWTADSGCEPRIRIGVVLPTDDMQTLEIDVPEGRYDLLVDGVRYGNLTSETFLLRGDGGRVSIRSASGDTIADGDVIEVVPLDTPRGSDSAGVRLHDVVTGRGFHWQKLVSFTFEGCLEFRSFDGLLLAVNELGVEQYLQGVITAEMSGQCPIEFLKSQCIVARSWVLAHTEAKHGDWPIDRCNDDCCQRFQGTTNQTERAARAVAETRGHVVVDATGFIIDANYSKSCGGIIEAPEYVWFTRKPCLCAAVDAPVASAGSLAVGRLMPIDDANIDEYLTGDWLADTDVFCSPNVVPECDLPRYLGSVDEGGGHFRWRIEYPREDLEALLRRKLAHAFDEAVLSAPDEAQPVLVADLPPAEIQCRLPMLHRLHDLRVTKRGQSGRAYELHVEYESGSGRRVCLLVRSEYRIRQILHERFLYSSALSVEIQRNADGMPTRIILVGAGWGHGAGLCQIGALGMAIKGHACRDILRHYLDGAVIRALY